MFIWTDLETTGLDPAKDEILAVGLLITDNAFKEIARAEWVAHVPAGWKAMREMVPVVLEMHKKNGLLERSADSVVAIQDVERAACAFLDQHLGAPAEKITDRPPMAGNSVHFDRGFLLRHCPELIRRFNYRLLDVSTLKVLACATVPGAQAWNDTRPEAAHTPIADLEGSLAELAHWRGVLGQKELDRKAEILKWVAQDIDAALKILPASSVVAGYLRGAHDHVQLASKPAVTPEADACCLMAPHAGECVHF